MKKPNITHEELLREISKQNFENEEEVSEFMKKMMGGETKPRSPNKSELAQDLVVEINIYQDINSYNMVINNSNAENIRIDIYDINGKLFAKQTSDLVNGAKSFNFDISNYQSGVYIVGVVADGVKMSSYKFTVTK